jgi:hypothetical protein
MAKGDFRRGVAAIEDGYAAIPKLILYGIAAADLTPLQRQVCDFLALQLYSWRRDNGHAPVGAKQWRAVFGDNWAYARRAARRLVRSHVLVLDGNEWSFNRVILEWPGVGPPQLEMALEAGCLYLVSGNSETGYGLRPEGMPQRTRTRIRGLSQPATNQIKQETEGDTRHAHQASNGRDGPGLQGEEGEGETPDATGVERRLRRPGVRGSIDRSAARAAAQAGRAQAHRRRPHLSHSEAVEFMREMGWSPD